MYFDRFNNKKKQEPISHVPIQASVKPLNYSEKILVAWGEAISGNTKIRDFLIKNGYKELGVFCFALTNDHNSIKWLMQNGYTHLAAMIKASEEDQQALKWLHDNKFDILKFMALAIQGDKNAMKWLNAKDPFAGQLAHKMKLVKDHIDDRNNSVHQINP